MDFQNSNLQFKTITTTDFFDSVYRISNCEFHLDHSHVTGNVKGFVHNFCNWDLRENKQERTCFAHNIFELIYILL